MKGQYFSFDAIIGGVIFILTAMALFSYWYGISGTLDQRHEMLAKEAFRVSEMVFTPVDPGFAVGWRDAHLNISKIGYVCNIPGDPQTAFGSGYAVKMEFYKIGPEGNVDDVCAWGPSPSQSDNVYRFRRAVSYLYGDGNTSLGYVDILVYEPPRTE